MNNNINVENKHKNVDYRYRHYAFFTPPFYILFYIMLFIILYNGDIIYEKKIDVNIFFKIDCDFQYIKERFNIYDANFYYNFFYILSFLLVPMSFIGGISIYFVSKYFFKDMKIQHSLLYISYGFFVMLPLAYLFIISEKGLIGCTNFRLNPNFVHELYPADIKGALGRLIIYFWILNVSSSYIIFHFLSLVDRNRGEKNG